MPRHPRVSPRCTTDVVYGHKDGLALTFDVHRPAQPNGAGVIAIVSGGWQSSVEMGRLIAQIYPPLNEKGFTVFAVRHCGRSSTRCREYTPRRRRVAPYSALSALTTSTRDARAAGISDATIAATTSTAAAPTMGTTPGI